MNDTAHNVAFLRGTYDEALQLAREARDYFAHQEPKDRATLPPQARLVISRETMRITTRLTQVIAWLLIQRAVEVGEVSREAAVQPKHRLGAHDVCAPPAQLEVALPARLEELMERSHLLFQRVARLDSMVAGEAD